MGRSSELHAATRCSFRSTIVNFTWGHLRRMVAQVHRRSFFLDGPLHSRGREPVLAATPLTTSLRAGLKMGKPSEIHSVMSCPFRSTIAVLTWALLCEGCAPLTNPFSRKTFCSKLARNKARGGQSRVREVLFDALQVYVGPTGAKSTTHSTPPPPHPRPPSPGLLDAQRSRP